MNIRYLRPVKKGRRRFNGKIKPSTLGLITGPVGTAHFDLYHIGQRTHVAMDFIEDPTSLCDFLNNDSRSLTAKAHFADPGAIIDREFATNPSKPLIEYVPSDFEPAVTIEGASPSDLQCCMVCGNCAVVSEIRSTNPFVIVNVITALELKWYCYPC